MRESLHGTPGEFTEVGEHVGQQDCGDTCRAGGVLDAEIEVAEIPDAPTYGYVDVDGRPGLDELASRTVIWVRD